MRVDVSEGHEARILIIKLYGIRIGGENTVEGVDPSRTRRSIEHRDTRWD
jgi:hypothetical protein